MNTSPSLPPRLAVALLRAAAPAAERAFIIADLDEEFAQLQQQAGRAAAFRWCWAQVARSLVPLLGSRVRSLRVSAALGGVLGDLRYAVRLFRRVPLVSASLVLAIAGGIGATTALVSVMEGVVLQPLPFSRPDRLVQLGTAIERFGRAPEMNFLDAEDTRRQSTALASLAQYDVGPGTVRFDADAPAVAATFLAAGRDLDRVLDLAPALGRGFDAGEYRAGAATVVLLTNRFWRSRFGADPAVIGRTIDIGSGRASIVGVLPPAADRFPVGGRGLWAAPAVSPASFLY